MSTDKLQSDDRPTGEALSILAVNYLASRTILVSNEQ